MRVTIVVAASINNVIGRNGELPWRLPADLKRFKRITMGKPIVMGRRTFESIGRPLPGRRNIVISSNQNLAIAGCEVVHSPDEAVSATQDCDEVMIIGGEHVYEDFLPRTDCIEITRVQATVDGDAFFPVLEDDEWRCVWSEAHPATGEQPLAFTFQTLERKQGKR